MADEPRRSGRATKGQYTKDRDIDEATGKGKGKKGKGGKKAVEDDEEEEEPLVRCVCGLYDEEEEVERSMICCDNCEAWQHNDCMLLPDDPSYQPEHYFCEQCRPEDHKDLLAAMARGEKPWEEVARRREEAAEAAKSTKKGGKRGRKSAVSRASQDVDESGTPARSGQKRRLEESPAAGELKGIKKARSTETPEAKNGVRKSSAVATPSRQASIIQGGVVSTINQLNSQSRKGVAATLVKEFVNHIKAAVKQGAHTLPSGTTAEQSGTHLGLLVEHALYHNQSGGSGEPNGSYKDQTRAIVFNVKKNADLRDRVLSGDISPHALSLMNPKEMASDELRRKDAATQRELEKQHTIVQEQGPRIRRTHKGEEYVDEADQIAAESTVSHAAVRRPSTSAQDGERVKSPDAMSPSESITRQGRPASQGRPRPSIDTQRKSSANFNIDNVWSTVQGSPDATQQRFPELRAQSPGIHGPAGPGTRADADIDALLKDEDAESPPYSPKDYADNDGTIWRGLVNGNNLGKFLCSAKFAAGCPIENLHMTYSDLIPDAITIGGRIDPVKADEYLCGLQYSQSSDVVVISITPPENSNDEAQFNKVFTYFKSRNRYGVGIQHKNPAIKDIYIMPLDINDPLPGLLQLLPNKLDNPVGERMLLVPFVVKNTELAHNIAPAGGPQTPIQQTPITPYDGAPQDYPHPQIPYQHSNGGPTPNPQAPPQPFPQNQNSTPTPQQSPAAFFAQQILGPELAKAPAVVQLIQQAPLSAIDEMNVVKDCISEDPMAAQDLNVLTLMLQRRYDTGNITEPT